MLHFLLEMSSQRSSSVRAVSGAEFEPMSGDPLYRDVSTPSAFRTKLAPKVASHPSAREATGLEHEVVSTSGLRLTTRRRRSRLAVETWNPRLHRRNAHR